MGQPFPKLSAEVRFVSADYTSAAEIVNGATISSATATVAPSDTLTVGSTTVSGNVVSFKIAGGTVGETYTLTCLATTDTAAVIGAQGQVQVVATLPN